MAADDSKKELKDDCASTDDDNEEVSQLSSLVSSLPELKERLQQKPEINKHAKAPMMTGTNTETEFLRRFANFASIHDCDTDSDVDNIGIDPDADFSDEVEANSPASLIECDSENSKSGLAETHIKKPSKAREILKFINEVSGSKSKGNNSSVVGGGRPHHASTNSLNVAVTDAGTYNGIHKQNLNDRKIIYNEEEEKENQVN